MQVYIFGAGGLGRGVLQILNACAGRGDALACAGFLVDAAYPSGDSVRGLPVRPGPAALAEHTDATVIIAIAAPGVRRRIAGEIAARYGQRFASVQHPLAMLGDNVALGPGCAIFPGVFGGGDLRIGAHCMIQNHVHLGHDAVLEDFVTVSPGAIIAGRAHIGEGAEIGLGARILPGVRIGRGARIGAGAVATRDIPDAVTAYGVPARVVSAHGVDDRPKE